MLIFEHDSKDNMDSEYASSMGDRYYTQNSTIVRCALKENT